MYALEAVNLITKYLPVAVHEGKNLEARSAVAWASTESGIVESLSSCVSHHSMQHALSAFHPELPHGAGLIALSIAYFSFMAEKRPDRFVDLAKAMGKNIDLLPEKEKAFSFITALKKLIKNIGMDDLKLSNFGIRKEEAEILAKNSMDTMGSLFKSSDPYKLSLEEVISIYNACL